MNINVGDIVIAYAVLNEFQCGWVLGTYVDEHTIMIDRDSKSLLTKCSEIYPLNPDEAFEIVPLSEKAQWMFEK